MEELARLHPLTLVQRALRSLPVLALALVSILSGSNGIATIPLIVFGALYGLVALPLIVVQYLRFGYSVTRRAITIHSGVLTRRRRNIPLERVQNVVVERSLLPRLLGTAKVRIETAGSKEAEGVLEYVSLAEAEKIREIVRLYRHEAVPVVEGPVSDRLFTMTLGRMFLSGTYRFSLVYIAIIFSGFQYFGDAIGLSPESVAEFLVGGGAEEMAMTARASPWEIGAVTILAAIAFGWLTGVAVTVTRYWGFRLDRSGDKILRRHGLFTVREGAIPLKRVQSLILRQNPLMRAFGWYRLELQTVGYDVEKRGYQVAVPFARLAEILELAPHILPFSLPTSFEMVSPLHFRRTMVRYTISCAVLLAVPAYWWPQVWWGLMLLPALCVLALLQYRLHGFVLTDDFLFIRRGVFQSYLWIVPTERLQSFSTVGNPFQRRLGLRSVLVDTAGAQAVRYPHVVDLAREAADEFTDALYARFKESFRAVQPEAHTNGLGQGS